MSMSERCLLGAFRVAITSQAVGLPPVSNTLACGLALALATSQARNRHYPYPSLLAELMRRGYTPEELKQVAGLNLLRVFREVEKVSARLRRENP